MNMGGKVFNNTKPIETLQERDLIVRTIERDLGIIVTKEDFLGSAMYDKFPTSDLDIAIHPTLCPADILIEAATTKGFECVQRGTVVHVNLRAGNGHYQIDFMAGPTDWLRFAYASSRNSKYKGVYRTIFIRAIAAGHQSAFTHAITEDGNLIARAGFSFLLNKGLCFRYRHRAHKKNGEGRVKAFTEITPEEFGVLYNVNRLTNTFDVIDAHQAACMLLGELADHPVWESFENMNEHLRIYFPAEYNQTITIYKDMLRAEGLAIPDEVA